MAKSQMVTFVTIGKLKGKTVNIGPKGKFRFVNGEMQVPDEDSALIATALRWYCAFPKGDAERYHLAACEKLGIDPETLAPLGAELAPAPEVKEEKPTKEEEDDGLSETQMNAVFEVLMSLEFDDEMAWTSAGKPSLPYVRSKLDDSFSSKVNREILNSIGIKREDSLPPASGEE